MNDFVSSLEKRASDSLKIIRAEEAQILILAKRAMRIFESLFDELKTFVRNYEFENNEDEIRFFKQIKPRLFWQLIYYQKIYILELDRPTGGKDVQIEYLKRELEHLRYCFSKNKEFYHYYRDGADHLDSKYFLRGKIEMMYIYENYYFYNDSSFSTIGDYKISEVISNDMVETYLNEELAKLDDNGMKVDPLGFPATKLIWKGRKAELQEQILSWDSAGSFGDVPLTQLYYYIQNVFNIQLDSNLSRSFGDLKIRNTPTPFLDKLKEALLRRMGRE